LFRQDAPAAVCRHAGGAASLLGDSYDSLALQLLGEVEAGAPLIAAKVQPAKFKPYLSAVLKVRVTVSKCSALLICGVYDPVCAYDMHVYVRSRRSSAKGSSSLLPLCYVC
jgi:hypothetical protein